MWLIKLGVLIGPCKSVNLRIIISLINDLLLIQGVTINEYAGSAFKSLVLNRQLLFLSMEVILYKKKSY